MSLTVGLLHYTAPPVIGGVEAVIGHQARLLVAGGHRVRIIAGRGRAPARGIELARIPLADVRHPRVRAARVELDAGRVPADFDALVAELSAELAPATSGLDVLVAHNACSLHLNLVLTAALRDLLDDGRLPPLVAWDHDVAWGAARFAGDLHPGRPWDLLAEAWPRTTHVAISEARRQEVAGALRIDPEAVAVVANGIDVAEFTGLHPATLRVLEPLHLPAVGPVLLAPSRVTSRKNLELAIAAVARLREDGADARLLLTGPPDPHEARAGEGYPARLAALAADLGVAPAVHHLARGRRRRMPGYVVADLYRIADALLLTSRDEGFGLPILEAAICRLPIVCADLPVLRELAGPAAAYFPPDAGPDVVAAAVRSRLDGDAAALLRGRVRASMDWSIVFTEQIEPLLVRAASQHA